MGDPSEPDSDHDCCGECITAQQLEKLVVNFREAHEFNKNEYGKLESERNRYKSALQQMVDASNDMGNGIYLSAQSCNKIALEALKNV